MVELGFYVLVPLMFAGRFRNQRFAWVSIAAWAICSLLVMRYYFRLQIEAPEAALTKLLSINPLTDLWEFLIGAFCSIYWDRLRPFFEGKVLWWLAAYLGAAVLMKMYFDVDSLNTHTNTPLMPLVTLLMAGVVMSFAFSWRNAASILRDQDFSYGIYLYHLPIIVTLQLLGFAGQGTMWFVVLGGTLICAALSRFLVELPALRLKPRVDQWLARLARSRFSLQTRQG